MKRVVIALLVGLLVQCAVWFLVPDGKLGSCGPINDVAAFKFMLLMPGILAAEWLHLGERLGFAMLLVAPIFVYALITWLILWILSRIRESKVA